MVDWPEDMPRELSERFEEDGPVKCLYEAIADQFEDPDPGAIAAACIRVMAHLIQNGYAIMTIPDEVRAAAGLGLALLTAEPDDLPN